MIDLIDLNLPFSDQFLSKFLYFGVDFTQLVLWFQNMTFNLFFLLLDLFLEVMKKSLFLSFGQWLYILLQIDGLNLRTIFFRSFLERLTSVFNFFLELLKDVSFSLCGCYINFISQNEILLLFPRLLLRRFGLVSYFLRWGRSGFSGF